MYHFNMNSIYFVKKTVKFLSNLEKYVKFCVKSDIVVMRYCIYMNSTMVNSNST